MDAEFNTAEDKKRKRKAAIIAVIFHVVITLLFLFFGLTQPDPLPEQQGASIEFGWDADGSMADLQTPQAIPTPAPVPESEPTPVNEVEEEVLTQDDSEVSVPVVEDEKPKPVEKPKPKPDPKPDPKPEPKPDPEPAEEKPQVSDALKQAMEAFGKPGEGNKGETTGAGTQGNPQGTEGQGSLGGGSGSWQLDGRSMMPGYGTKIRDTKEEGIVVLNITVDRTGKVTGATPNLAESTTTSQTLVNLATRDVIENFRFNADPNASFEQRGKVKYVFQLK